MLITNSLQNKKDIYARSLIKRAKNTWQKNALQHHLTLLGGVAVRGYAVQATVFFLNKKTPKKKFKIF